MPTHIKEFQAVCGFPQGVGALDGCHIPVSPPKEHATDYYNYKGWYSIVLLALVDHKYLFRYVNVGSPGRCHDAYMYRQSALAEMVSGPLFQAPAVVMNGVAVPPLILCDQAFPLTPNLVKSFKDVPDGSRRRRLDHQANLENFCRVRLFSEMSCSDSDNESCSFPFPKKKYVRKYKAEWEMQEQFRGCISRSTKGINFAYCKACDVHLAARKRELEKHVATKKHVSNAKKLVGQQTLLSMPSTSQVTQESSGVSEGEIGLAAFLAEHNLTFTVMEHLPKLMAAICTDSNIMRKIVCGRTKAAAIMRNVTGRESKEKLCSLLRTNKFSLIVDEATDSSCCKHLCLLTRVFDASRRNCSGYDHIVVAFAKWRVPYKQNMVEYAAGGANVMMGTRNSPMTRLREHIPNLFVMKCICHSFHTCASYACEKLPHVVEDEVKDIYKYFHASPKRQERLKALQAFLDSKPQDLASKPDQMAVSALCCSESPGTTTLSALRLSHAGRSYHSEKVVAGLEVLQRIEQPFPPGLEYVVQTILRNKQGLVHVTDRKTGALPVLLAKQ
ncbi:hypothetical protein HPB50_017562 [Hyalomma asiaticum]|uniref:Uncharacterized protein n=1 Tax=Hyalomma asiaticum TaxID=266040 RepID=A0ACB7SRP0_HYAAI|nr:hypothetical protein HPB50_017562 [Hyalomma asiaticum]